nr:sugar-transfer associated ATP-grasp domain-containing protein [Parahaliea mediterranea]
MDWVIDKRRFWCVAGDLELPVVPVLATFESGRRTTGDGALPRRDLFHKPLGAFGGEGAECWRYLAEGDHWQQGEHRLSEAGLLAHCAAADSILQPRLLSHGSLRELMGDALGTVRIVTLRRASGDIQVLAAVLKLPASEVAIDAYWAGGLAAPVDCDTGKLRAATARDLCRGNFSHHPETGAVIAGRRVPYWREALCVVKRGHAGLDQLTSLGWDVAITGDGPVVIEANTGWNFELMQAAGGGPLGTGVFAEWAAGWLPGEARDGALAKARAPDTGTRVDPRPSGTD